MLQGLPEMVGDVNNPNEPLWAMFSRWLISLHGERHRAMRARFQTLFVPRRVALYRAGIQLRAGALLDARADDGEMDLVSHFAHPLPFGVIAEILGVPTELASNLPDDPDALLDIVANCVFFVEAGHATTTSLIAGGTLLLLENPAVATQLRREPALIGSAVEEMLRLVTPVAVVPRTPREDVEIAGCPFRREETRVVFLAGANRDPDVFSTPGSARCHCASSNGCR